MYLRRVWSTSHDINDHTVRSAAQEHDNRFRECVSLQAQYVFGTFGKFPGIVPSIFLMQYLQAHHLDPEFYDMLTSRELV